MKRGRTGDAPTETVDVNMAQVLMLLSRGAVDVAEAHQPHPGRVFECKTCNRQFPSFQALGGHRASHKKPKPLDDQGVGRPSPSKPRVHECSICGLEFALGQALGGHMRRHRVTAAPDHLITPSADDRSARDAGGDRKDEEEGGGHKKRAHMVTLDLNLTPMENDAELRLLAFSLGLPMVH